MKPTGTEEFIVNSPAAVVDLAGENPVDKSTDATGKALKDQSLNALIVQGYTLSLNAQANISITDNPKLKPIEESINKTLGTAREGANEYLNNVHPKLISTIANIETYFALQMALGQTLNPSTDSKTAVSVIEAVKEQVGQYSTEAHDLVTKMDGVRQNFSNTSSSLGKSASDLSTLITGDNGVLDSIDSSLSSLDKKINGAISGVVLSALAIAGGVVMIGVGALAEPVTGGMSTALIVGGLAVGAAGVGGEVASATILSTSLKLKSELLSEKAKLHAEVTLAAGLKSSFSSLSTQAGDAAGAVQGMANAWTSLSSDLGNMSTLLGKGEAPGVIGEMFLKAARNSVPTVQGDITTIKQQLQGASASAKVDHSTTAADLAAQWQKG